MINFRIGTDASEYLIVEITGRTNPSALDYWDGNWVNANIEIYAGGFRGRYSAYLRTKELKDFRDAVTSLYSFKSKEASLETLEGQLSINITGDSLGHFAAKCEAMDQAGIGNRLIFTLTFDQTDIPAMLKELDVVIKEYPIIGNPND